MYYSIPEVRKIFLLMRDVNYADIMSPKQADKTAEESNLDHKRNQQIKKRQRP
jgi:hypothetical protein